MQRWGAATAMVLGFALFLSAMLASGQVQTPRPTVTVTVLDEDGLPVTDAQVTLSEPGRPAIQLRTDFAGRCTYSLRQDLPYRDVQLM